MEFFDLIIDNNSDQTDRLYTYGSELPGLVPGSKVAVSFSTGSRKKNAYVHSVIDPPEKKIRGLKYIEEMNDAESLPSDGIAVVDWMRGRYFCRRIDAVKCFTPSGRPPKRTRAAITLFDVEAIRKDAPVPTEEQTAGIEAILPSIKRGEHRVFLIHGVTSSGKTEIYLRIIQECVAQGRTAIMLVPEIALTAQMIQRFFERFGGEPLAVLHSKLSLGERYDQWKRIKDGLVPIVVGARSAVFAPLENIGAIIVDEEHETSYKSDMTPKYDTIEVATKRAALHNAVLVLGSATPSMESLYHSEQGTYQKIVLTERFNLTPLPSVEIIDMRKELQEGNKSIFSRELYRQTTQELEKGKQVIFFLNRRGYSTFLSCRNCGYVMSCDSCGISMTYHKMEAQAVCHYCGKKETVPPECPACGSKYLKHFGTGTEKVEEVARQTFPDATIDRLDMDTAKRKGSADQILRRFGRGETHILIGTQLVAKGLDFEHVGLVGILSADLSLNIPDYRSPERTFQLITQSSGRAGRGDTPGRVLIQTYSPDHYAIQAAAENDHAGFYQQELATRRNIGYPPFSDLIRIVLGASEEVESAQGIEKIKQLLQKKVGADRAMQILGPRPAPLAKVNELYRYQLLIKSYPGEWKIFRNAIWEIKEKVIREKGRVWTLSIDVNPFGFL